MSEKLVLCCRLPGAGMPSRGRGYLERARSLIVRAEARGGTLVAWGNARLYFSFDPTTIDDVIALVTKPGDEGRPGEERFAFGVAQGPLEQLESDGSRADLAWGHALIAAGALAMAGRAGQVLFADRVKAVRTGELVLNGGRFAAEAGMRLRGLTLDVLQPWKRDAVASVGRIVEPALVAAEADAALAVKPGTYGVLVAPRGHGGTRRLSALGKRFGDRVLMVRPAGASLEPLGALRRAVARALHDDIPPALAPHASALESLLSSEPLSIDVAEDLVSAFVGSRTQGGAPGVVLVDDAELVDPETLEVLANAMRGATPLPVVVRITSPTAVPAAFAKTAPSATVVVAPLADDAAQALAAAFTADALAPDAKRRWARLGQGTPLGILEALTHGLQSTELAWIGDRAAPRRKSSGRGKPRPATHFVTLRAHECSPAARTLLATIALLGGEARLEHLAKIMEAADQPVSVDVVAKELARTRWLLSPEAGWVALPSRTHVEALGQLLERPLVQALRRAAVDVIDSSEIGFGKLEAVHHALAIGDAERARRIVSAALLALGQARHMGSATRLRALVDLGPVSVVVESTDEHTAVESTGEITAASPLERPAAPTTPAPPAPQSEPTFVLLKAGPTSALMSAAVPLPPVSESNESKVPTQENPKAIAESAPDSEPPTIADAAPILTSLAQLQRTLTPLPPPPPKVAVVAPAPKKELSLQEQVKAAIMASNQEELERLLSGPGIGDTFVDRVRALSRLKRGEIGEALRVLRRVRHGPDATPSARSQSALSLGIAYAASSRFEESLLEGLTALARAREAGDARGVHACLSFLARLFTIMSRPEEASQLREAASGITVA